LILFLKTRNPIKPETNEGIIQIAKKVKTGDLNGSQKKGNFSTPYKAKNSGILLGNSVELVICKYIAAQYPPRAKNIPCPRLNKPVYPQIRSTPRATMDKDKYLPRRFSLNTGSNVGAAIIKAINIIQKHNIIFLSNLNLLRDISFQPSFLFEEINL
jgi:hypothetical protein